MLSNPARINRSLEEAIVTEVDVIHFVCKVRTLSGQKITGVQWPQPSGGSSRGGDRVTPFFGDRVIIDSGLGYTRITQFLPKLQNSDNVFPLSIDTGQTLVDTGNFTEGGSDALGDQNAPRDMLSGDRIITSPGGGLFGLLRGGSVLLKSSKLSQIYLCKWNDLVRIVSRNWEHFTDVCSDVVVNLGGRVYRYIGYAHLSKDAKVENYRYHDYYGDVALAESVKTDYQDAGGGLPATSTIIRKEQVITGGGDLSELFKREIHLDGTQDIVVKIGSTFTRIKSTNGEIVITYNDNNIIKVNNNEISLRKGSDQHLVILDGSGIRAIYNDAEVNLDSTSVTSTFSGSTNVITSSSITSTVGTGIHVIDGSGITSTYGAAIHKLDATSVTSIYGGAMHRATVTGVYSTFGPHFMNVTAAGIQLG